MYNNDRINLILHNDKFNEYLNKNNALEKSREFCIHDINHLIDVARIAYIIVLEKNINYSKDIIYAAALLHDIGRWQQYEQNIPHEAASAKLSKYILEQSNYNSSEIDLIYKAIINHRKASDENTLDYIIYKSDKISRKCFNCVSINKCKWSQDKKNYGIIY